VPLNKLINELVEKKLNQNKKKKSFGTLQGYVSFIISLIIIYINKENYLDVLDESVFFLFFAAFPFIIIFTALCVIIYKLINSLRNYKRDWKVLMLYSTFIISFLGNKYYFKNVLGNYTIAFTVSFFVFVAICIFFNGINNDFGED